jgi:hypothetical protein
MKEYSRGGKAYRNTCDENERILKRRKSKGILVLKSKEKYRNTCFDDQRLLNRQKNVGILGPRMKEY